MSAFGERAERQTFRLSDRLSVEITAGLGGFVVEWMPQVPQRLTGGELRRYRRARGRMLDHLAERVGGGVLCVEV
jgi:hypothetical protein